MKTNPDKHTKNQLVELAEAAGADYASDATKAEIAAAIDEARTSAKASNKAEAEAELTADDKRGAMLRLIEERPETVLMPTRQGMLRIEHPEVPGTSFTISLFGDEPAVKEVPLETFTRRLRPVESERPAPPKSHGTPLSEAPEWVLPRVYDLVKGGYLMASAEPEVLDPGARRAAVAILDDDTADVRTRLAYGRGGDNVILTTEGAFTEAEQEAAFNVLLSEKHGRPLPPSGVETDPRLVTGEEVIHVETRLRECLDDPKRWTTIALKGGFRKRMFFNQLLEMEFEGRTPQRSVSTARFGGTRPAILQMYRRVAAEFDLVVVGDYVVEKTDTELRSAPAPMPIQQMIAGEKADPAAPYKSYYDA